MLLDSIFQFGFIQKKHIETTFMPLHNVHRGAVGGSKHKAQFQSASSNSLKC